MEIKYSSIGIAKKMAIGVFVLLAAHLFFQTSHFIFGHNYVMGLLALFNLDGEYNIPSLYSFLLFLSAAKLLGYIAYHAHRTGQPFITQWAGLSIGFVCLALDELLSIHETWGQILPGFLRMTGFSYCVWQIPYAILFLILLPFYYPFFKNLKHDLCKRMLIAAGLYFTGAVVFETLGGWYYSGIEENNDIVYYMLFVPAEEILEMTGLVVLIYALLEHIRATIGSINIKLEA